MGFERGREGEAATGTVGLIQKYKKMPKKNPDASSYMPILQDYDLEIKPILDEF